MSLNGWIKRKPKALTFLKSYCLMIWQMTNHRKKRSFLKRFGPAQFFVPAAILLLPSSDSVTGIIAGAVTKKMARTPLNRNGGCLQKIKTSRLKRLTSIYRVVED